MEMLVIKQFFMMKSKQKGNRVELYNKVRLAYKIHPESLARGQWRSDSETPSSKGREKHGHYFNISNVPSTKCKPVRRMTLSLMQRPQRTQSPVKGKVDKGTDTTSIIPLNKSKDFFFFFFLLQFLTMSFHVKAILQGPRW